MAHPEASIQRRLMTVILLTCTVVLLLTCATFVTYEVITLRKNMVRGLTTRAEIIGVGVSTALESHNKADATEILAALKSDVRAMAACAYDDTGKILGKYPAEAPDNIFPAKPEPAGNHFDSSSLVVFAPVVQGGKTLGTVFLKSDLSAFTERFRGFAWLTGGIFIGSILVAYLLSRQLQRKISRPILALAETAKAISKRRDFSVRATKSSDGEMGLLTDAFNDMLAEIHKLNATLEQRVQERTAELQAVNKELESFSYSVSHDLRAPLRHINGFAEMLQENSESQLNEAGRRQLKVICDSAKRMGALIDDLLVFSRIGRAAMRPDRLKMDQLVTEVLQEMSTDFQSRRIKWEVSRLPDAYGDRALLKQVWINLIANAVKYSRHRDPAEITIWGRANGANELEFAIRDNGAGFDMQYAGKLFGVFQRLHLAEEFEGTGIGLANVQRIILRHGGRVWAEGKVDEGATFYFTLPDIDKRTS